MSRRLAGDRGIGVSQDDTLERGEVGQEQWREMLSQQRGQRVRWRDGDGRQGQVEGCCCEGEGRLGG